MKARLGAGWIWITEVEIKHGKKSRGSIPEHACPPALPRWQPTPKVSFFKNLKLAECHENVLQGRYWQSSSAWCLLYAKGPCRFKTFFFLRCPQGWWTFAGQAWHTRTAWDPDVGCSLPHIGMWSAHSLGGGSPLNSSFCPSRYRPTSLIYRRVFQLPANPLTSRFLEDGSVPMARGPACKVERRGLDHLR